MQYKLLHIECVRKEKTTPLGMTKEKLMIKSGFPCLMCNIPTTGTYGLSTLKQTDPCATIKSSAVL